MDLGSPMPNLKDLRALKWTTLAVSNGDIASGFAFGSVLLTQNELLLFGGNKTNTYLFDFANTLAKKPTPVPQSGIAKVTTVRGIDLCTPAVFCYQSDYVARLFGNYLYAIDSFHQNLHVYSLKDRIWNYSPLRDLGVTI